MVEVHQNLRAKVTGGTGGSSCRGRDITLIPWGFPGKLRRNEEFSHQNFSSAPQFYHVLNSGPRGSWSFGNPSLIIGWLLLQRGGCACGDRQGRRRPRSVFPSNIPNASEKDIPATLLCFFFFKCQLNWLCSHQEATNWKETQLNGWEKWLFLPLPEFVIWRKPKMCSLFEIPEKLRVSQSPLTSGTRLLII